MIFVKNKIVFESEEEITFHKAEKKTLRRENKGVRAGFQQQLKEREYLIKNQQEILAKKEKLAEYLLDRSVKQFENEYSENRAAFVFKHMKDRFWNLKNCFNNLARRVETMKMRRGLKKIKHASSENLKISSLRNMLLGAFKRYGFRYIKHAFDT